MSKKIDNLLYEILTGENIVKKTVLDEVVARNANTNGYAWIVDLSKAGLIDEKNVLRILAGKIGIQFKPLKREAIQPNVLKKVPIKIASHYQFVPLALKEDILTIGVYYPLDIKTLDEIRFHLGYEVEQVLSEKEDILELLKKNYGLGAETIDRMFLKGTFAESKEYVGVKDEAEDIEKQADDATISNLVNQIIFDAYKKRATDIHIEPYRGGVRFRYRIDGVLHDANVSPKVKHFIVPVFQRIKIMSNLDIVEHRLPQDGQAVVKTSDQRIDLRISCIPTIHGESIVVRILPSVVLYDFQKLGLLPEDKKLLEELLDRPNGIIFVTGPTGSGKTTTLYACLGRLNGTDRKIITIEDPVEYEISGVTQIQVNPHVGLTFSTGLKSMLRHDPDIMMVGEVRDFETAEIAIRIALTGHLVFSTLHTNSAAASVHRLFDIGIEPYLVHSSTIAFIAQRLVRVLCPKCKTLKQDVDPKEEKFIKSKLGLKAKDKLPLYKQVGCDYCDNTGYYGRTAIYEILVLNPEIKSLIQEKAAASKIENAAVKNGMRTLLVNGLEKVISGITTFDEIVNTLSITSVGNEEEFSKKEETPGPVYIQGTTETSLFEKVIDNQANRSYKRIYPRLTRSFPVTFSVQGKTSDELEEKIKNSGMPEAFYWQEHNAFTEDISAGGLMFKHNIALVIGTILQMTINYPSGEKEPINCLARVMRIEPSGQKDYFNIAVNYLDMSTSDRASLNAYIENELRT